MRRIKGFTLIELLVVVSIIALLVSILMPALGRARQVAQKTVCMTGLRSLGYASNLYLIDNNNRFSHGKSGSTQQEAATTSWLRDFAPYFEKTAEILTCAATTKASDNEQQMGGYGTEKEGWRWDWQTNDQMDAIGIEKGYNIGYAYNQWATYPNPKAFDEASSFGQAHWKVKYCWDSLDNVSRASNVPLLADGRWMYGFPLEDDTPMANQDDDWMFDQDRWGINMFNFDRHQNSSINMLFMDNSARNVKLSELYGLKWHKEFSLANDYARGVKELPAWMR